MTEGPYARVTAVATVLILMLSYMGLAASEHWWPFRLVPGGDTIPQAASKVPVRHAANEVTDAVIVSGPFGRPPSVDIPVSSPPAKLLFKTEIQGNGPDIAGTDAVLADFAVYDWANAGHKLLASTFATGPTILSGKILPGLQAAVDGQQVGSRILAVLPPGSAYGSSGDQQLGIGADDTLVYVVDLLKEFSATASAVGAQVTDGGNGLPTVKSVKGSAPAVTIPNGDPPAQLVIRTLIAGSGEPVTKGQVLVVKYVGVIWRTGRQFSSSWSSHSPFSFVIGIRPAQVISGLDRGMLGIRVGSRVMLVVPPADAYGRAGLSSAGIKGADTLVFVVDVLGAFNRG